MESTIPVGTHKKVALFNKQGERMGGIIDGRRPMRSRIWAGPCLIPAAAAAIQIQGP